MTRRNAVRAREKPVRAAVPCPRASGTSGADLAREYALRLQANTMPERDLLGFVLAMARALGWVAYHTHDSRHSAAGFPDVIAVRDGAALAFELKRQREDPTPEQAAWLAELARVPGVIAGIWRPMDWLDGTIERVLMGMGHAGDDGH